MPDLFSQGVRVLDAGFVRHLRSWVGTFRCRKGVIVGDADFDMAAFEVCEGSAAAEGAADEGEGRQ